MKKVIHFIKEHEMPLGLKFILGFYIYTLTIATWSFFGEPSVIFLGKVYTGYTANWISFILLVIDYAWVIALVQRLSWGWKLFVIWNLIGLPIGMITTLKQLLNTGNIRLLALSNYIAVIILVVMVCVYVYQKRSYFNR